MKPATQEIYVWLEKHDIHYTQHDHRAVFTVDEAATIEEDIPGIHAKTLLVRGEKTGSFFLVSLEGSKKLEQPRIKKLVGERVRFAKPEDLERILHVTPGSVSPLGLIFDTELNISSYIIDQDILESDIVTWHPNNNTQTLEFTQDAFQKILQLLPHKTLTY